MAKKKLQLLPEVLPDPRPARSVTGGPRTRTLDHLQKLLAASAVAAMGCGGGGGSSSGYAVVDPMPMPPPRCFDPGAKVRATATFIRDGVVALKVELLPGVDEKLGELVVTDETTKTKILSQSGDERVRSAEIELPPIGATTVSAKVTPCPDAPSPMGGVLRIAFVYSAGTKAGAAVNVSLEAEGTWSPVEPPPPPPDNGFAKPPPAKQ